MADDYRKEVEDIVFRAISLAAMHELQHQNVTGVPQKVQGILLREAARLHMERPDDRNSEAELCCLALELRGPETLLTFVTERYIPPIIPRVLDQEPEVTTEEWKDE